MPKIAVIGIAGESVFMTVDRFHQGGETIRAKTIHTELGGKGINQAVAAARQGAEVSFLCSADEKEVPEIRKFCEGEGIKCRCAVKESGSPYAVIITDSSGANRVTVYQGAPLTVDDLDIFLEDIRSSDILLLTNETPYEVNIKAAEEAKKCGRMVIVNPAPYRVPGDMVFIADLFTPNEYEDTGLEQAKETVVTLGSKGCLIKSTGKTLPPYDAGPAVDTTGAGDTFNGVLAASIASGTALEKACVRANTAAGIKVTRRYIMDSIPYRREIDVIMKSQS